MSKKSSKRNRSSTAFPDNQSAQSSPAPDMRPAAVVVSDARRWYLIAVFAVIALGGTYLAQAMRGESDVDRFTYRVIKKYIHDDGAFTQGLVLDGGTVYESTGKREGQSSIRKYKLEGNGEMIRQVKLPNDHFGEGLAKVGQRLYQLTWQEGICHVYDLDLEKIKEFQYDGQGWGLAYDGKQLIMSDGSSRLRFIDPETFTETGVVQVRLGYSQINGLNELEYSGGSVYANRLDWDSIYEIDPKTGAVKSIIELQGLWEDRPREGVLNGIAVDEQNGRVILTGKYCPFLYEVEFVPK